MALLRTLVLMAAAAILVLPGTRAQACDSNYPWLCKPVPSIDSAGTADSGKAAKPLSTTSRQKDGRSAKATKPTKAATVTRAPKAQAKDQRPAQTQAKHVAHEPSARRLVLRERHGNVAAAPAMAQDPAIADDEQTRTTGTEAKIVARKPFERAAKSADALPSVADAGSAPNGRFAAAWQRGIGRAEPVGAAAATEGSERVTEPAATAPVPAASQPEPNEIDLAVTDPAPPPDKSWVRGLFIAFGSMLALGSALRLLI
jgi:hypothetical protein